jgi:hypothetical protein
MMPPVSYILVLVLMVTSLVATQRRARPGVSHWSDTTNTGEKEGEEERIRGRVSLLREARAYRRFRESKRLRMPSRQPYKKAPKPSNSLNSKTRYRSFEKDGNNVKSTSRQPQAPVSRARPKANNENTRKKYTGVKFPKLDLFPQMRKASVPKIKVLKGNTTVTDTDRPSQHRDGQGKETEQTVNSKALESEQSSIGRPRPNYPKPRTDIRPTSSLPKDNPDMPTILVPSKEDDILAPDLMPSISADEDGFLTVTHTVFTRTKELYEETLTSLSEVIINQYLV